MEKGAGQVANPRTTRRYYSFAQLKDFSLVVDSSWSRNPQAAGHLDVRLPQSSTIMKDYYLDSTIFAPKKIAPESEVKEAKSVIRSCIMTYKNGIPTDSLRDEYKKLTGEEIPYLKLGYNSLFHFLRDIPEIRSSRNGFGEPVLIIQANEKTKHLQELIKNQKDPRTLRPRESLSRDKRRSNIKDKRKQNQKKYQDQKRKANSSSSSEYSVPVDEYEENRPIYNDYRFEEYITVCTTPILGAVQLLGDDYFLQLCIKYLSDSLERKDPKSAISCGTVQSGLTIKKALKRLDKINTMSNKLVINVGTVDIYNRRTVEEMIVDYKELVNKLQSKYGYSNSQITLCTLPPVANVALFCENNKYVNHAAFNNWLRDFATSGKFNLLDLHYEFMDENMVIDYNLFQQNARMVSGTIHPHVLFNYFGRQKLMKLLASI